MADDNTYWGAVKQRVRDLTGVTKHEQQVSKRKAAIDAATDTGTTAPPPPTPKADNPAGISFKSGGMVRRGYGKARGA
ncbi:hypothetical protein UFOVP228_78 [uncultured Caudovirales phage]|uniref:Uncharacterized protein n=1 Tax=uncultured Caudovirales phage TaxID=2100421 RepID=A0A6J7WN54_9CAUD|nr:hypothetical protein UFOVP47_24 [uncultured Caudovirales phage]CAB5219489.1 hypothetical protein UFOVP228_78 [uncultured Caudovirales phage]